MKFICSLFFADFCFWKTFRSFVKIKSLIFSVLFYFVENLLTKKRLLT